MKKVQNILLKKIFMHVKCSGIKIPSVRKVIRSQTALHSFFLELKRFSELESDIPVTRLFPVINEKNDFSGSARGHYFHQDLLVAQQIYTANPEKHCDVGSRIDGFVAHVASFRQIYVFDIRPLPAEINNIHFLQCDLMQELDPSYAGSCDSLSCLHALEHFGLGRYGDALCTDGHIKGLKQLKALLKPGGTLYLAVPIGPLRIEFNAHRVFSLSYLMQLFDEYQLTMEEFSYVNDAGSLHKKEVLSDAAIDCNFGCRYGCGIFRLRN